MTPKAQRREGAESGVYGSFYKAFLGGVPLV